MQPSLRGQGAGKIRRPPPRSSETLRPLITVRAAPNPSARYGQVACGGALDIKLGKWVRLYPIHHQDLDYATFRPYDLVRVTVLPARQDARRESRRPIVGTATVEGHTSRSRDRRHLLDPHVEDSMCHLNESAREDPAARSIGLVRVTDIDAFKIEPRDGWTRDEQRKIDAARAQLDLFDPDRHCATLRPPRFTGTFHYRCGDPRCRGHQQNLRAADFVRAQHHLDEVDDTEAAQHLRSAFLGPIARPGRQVAFCVGNQAGRPQAFSIGNVYAPED